VVQPIVFGKPRLTPYEERQANDHAYLRDFARECWREWAARLAGDPGFPDASDVFANDPEPRFIDFCHVGESGNDAIAERIVGDVERALARPSRAAPLSFEER
jgi:hypothetical protein